MKESSSAAVPLIPDPLCPVPFGTATGRLKTFRQASGMSTSNWSCIAVFVMLSALISRLNCYCHRFVGQSLYGSESGKPRALFGRVETMWGHQIFPGESYGKTCAGYFPEQALVIDHCFPFQEYSLISIFLLGYNRIMKTLWTALTEPHRLHIVELLRDGTVVELAPDAK